MSGPEPVTHQIGRAEIDRYAGEICGRSHDAKEALAAAVAKREPAFSGN